MKVTLERLPESRVVLDIEVDPERLEQSIDAQFRKFSNRARIPGFRPGKAPRIAIERHFGGAGHLRAALMDDALKAVVPDVYNEAIADQDVDAIGQPELEIVEVDPVRFKATVPVRPTVELNDYHSIRVARDAVDVTDQMVDAQVLGLRRRHAIQAPVDRPVQWDDILIADVSGRLSGSEEAPFVEDSDAEFPLREGVELLVPGLAEGFLGMGKGETKALDLAVPGDFRVERLREGQATFTLHIKEVKEEQLPEEDDEFANQVNADEFPTAAALRTRIREDLEKSGTQQATAKQREEALDQLVALATIEYPRVLIDREIDHIIRDATGNEQRNYAAYLQHVGKSEAEFRETFRETAEARLRRGLALSKLAEAEGVEPAPEDIEAELDRLVAPMGEDSARLRAIFGSEDGRATIRRNLITEQTLERLATIASGEPQEAPA